jgi:hypothetical protein
MDTLTQSTDNSGQHAPEGDAYLRGYLAGIRDGRKNGPCPPWCVVDHTDPHEGADAHYSATDMTAYIGTGLDATAAVTSVRIALDDDHDVLLDPDEAIAHAYRILGLALAAKASTR